MISRDPSATFLKLKWNVLQVIQTMKDIGVSNIEDRNILRSKTPNLDIRI